MLYTVGIVTIRSIASKLVPQEEFGAVHSVLGCTEALVPLVYGPIYSKIYAATLNIFPSAFYLVSALLITPAVFIFL